MRVRTRASVSPRQSLSAAILASIRREGSLPFVSFEHGGAKNADLALQLTGGSNALRRALVEQWIKVLTVIGR